MDDQKLTQTGLEVAVTGIAGRFPGAATIREFWNNLKNGVESITFFSDEELAAAGVAPDLLEDPAYIKANGILAGIDYFDASFFGYTPKEAEVMDPQIRIFHEVAWTALEDAGYDPLSYNGLIALYAGATPNFQWEARSLLSGKSDELGEFAATQLTRKDYLSLRISYKLNLTGPSFVLHSTCSTSLLAIHLACQALLNGECDMALAGGVSVTVLGKGGYFYHEGSITSDDGHCRAFDAAAKGMVGGNGSAVVVLKRLEEALAANDHIYAVVKGSATNNDGIRRAGFTAPSVEGQAEVIKMALQVAEVDPETIGYIETHGTATALGDSVEVEGLKLAFNTDKKAFCGIGSVKTNVGHMDAAAGVTGFLKALLALTHKVIPPSLHFEIPNPRIDFIGSAFYITSALTEWEEGQDPRRAGVSSFGIGGTNAHVVLEEWPGSRSLEWGRTAKTARHPDRAGISPASSREPRLIVLSARTTDVLGQMSRNLAEYLQNNPGINLTDTAYTLQAGRRALPCRWMAVCSSVAEAVEILATPGAGETLRVTPEEERLEPMETEPTADRNMLLQLGRLWLQGQRMDWEGLYSRHPHRRISLPTYPFERQRYWFEVDPLARGIKLSSPADRSPRFYVPAWKRTRPGPRKALLPDVKQGWLVFMNELSFSALLVEQLRERGQDIVTVTGAEEFSQVGDGDGVSAFTVNPAESSHYDALFTRLRETRGLPRKILHLWSLTPAADCQSSGESFDEAQQLGFYSLLYMAGALGRVRIDHDLRILLLSAHLADVLGEEALCPVKAPVLGLLKVIPQELPGIGCTHMDLDLPEAGSSAETALLRLLLEDVLDPPPEAVLAYRNRRRWVQVFEPLPLLENEPGRLPPGEGQGEPQSLLSREEPGVYLVTGGLGQMGLLFSRLLARQEGVRLVLTGRSVLPARQEWSQWLNEHEESHPLSVKIKKLQELEGMGARVLYLTAEVASREQMQQAVACAEERFGPVNGVIHAAGITAGSSFRPLLQLTRQDCQQLFQAKVYGLLVLDALFKEKPLDFFWVMSSLSSILGGLNLGAYSAAHEFVDLLVKDRNRSALPGPGAIPYPGAPSRISLNWENMDADLSTAAFSRLFSLENIDQVAASASGTIQSRIRKWINPGPAKENRAAAVKKSTGYPRPELSVPYAAPDRPPEETLCSIWEELFGFDRVGVDDDFFELGGDSLTVITVVSKIQKKMEVLIPIPTFFDNPTIRALADYIREEPAKETPVAIEAAEAKEYYNVTSAQKRLFVIHQMDENNTSYNMFNTIMLQGDSFGHRLESTFKKLIRRHEGLRTSFDVVHSEPVQRVKDRVDFAMDFIHLTAAPGSSTGDAPQPTAPESRVLQAIRDCIRPFDLYRAPLLRVGLIKFDEARHILVSDMHHIVSDGYSMGILVKEFLALYEGKELPVLSLRYTDYSEWLRDGNLRSSLQPQEQYWLKEFQGKIPELQMPMDFERPAVQSFEGDVLDMVLDEKATAGLQALAARENATLFMVLVALFNLFLAKISGQEDIVVGIGVAGRRYEELQKIIGIFVNTLAVRNFPARDKTFTAFLNEVKQKTLLAYENQDYQFEDLVEKVLPQRKQNRNPLFDVVIVSQDIAVNAADIPPGDASNLKARQYGHKNEVSKFDMTLICKTLGNKLWFIFEYCSKLFKPETIQRFIIYFREIAAQIIENPEARLRDITISHRLLEAKPENPEMELGF